VIAGDDLAAVRWEISWGLHRGGVTELWVLRAEHVGYLGWMWLRQVAEDEQLRLVLLTPWPSAQRAPGRGAARLLLASPESRPAPTGRSPRSAEAVVAAQVNIRVEVTGRW